MNFKPYLRPALFAVLCVSVLFCLAGFDGCTQADDQTAMKIDALTEELAQIRQILEQDQHEVNAGTLEETLTAQLETISKTLADNQAQIQELSHRADQSATVRQEMEAMVRQYNAVKAELQEASATIEQQQSELTHQAQKIAALETKNEQLLGQLEPAAPESTEQTEPTTAKVGFPTVEGFRD
jgi:DNA repair ATPase RecN